VPHDLHATVAARLRRVGYRYTAGRRALVVAIIGANRPMTASELTAATRGLPQSTMYRNLAHLEQAGVVHRVFSTDDYARFELAEELGGHHHHLVCVTCGTVEDFTAPGRFERILSELMSKVTDGRGFTAETHRLDLLGVCGTCAP